MGEPSASCRNLSDQRGSALILVPGALLIAAIAASLALERAAVLGEQRDLIATAEAAGTDALNASVDLDALRRDGVVRHDPVLVERTLRAALARERHDAVIEWHLADSVLHVEVTSPITRSFAPLLPGLDPVRVVTAHATARLLREDP